MTGSVCGRISRSVGALVVPVRWRPRVGRDRSWRHEIPDGADDGVELRAEPVLVGEDDVPEVLVLSNSLDGRWGWGTAWHCHRPPSGADRLSLLVLGDDVDAAWLRLFGNRDPQGEDAAVVARLDPAGVQVVTEEELPAEDAAWAL